MSSTKRPAPSADVPPAKKHNTGPAANELPATLESPKENTITPNLQPGAYRMVGKLRTSITGNAQRDHWPAVMCDQEMVNFLFTGKRQPKTAKEAHAYPGFFIDCKIPEKGKVVPMLLVNKNLAMWVPSSLLTTLDRASLDILKADETLSDEMRMAFSLVLENHDLSYWKDRMKGVPRPSGEAMYMASDEDEEEEERMAALNMLAARSIKALGRRNQSDEPRPSSPVDGTQRAVSVDAIFDGRVADSEPLNLAVGTKEDLEPDEDVVQLEGMDTAGVALAARASHEAVKSVELTQEQLTAIRREKANRKANPDEVRISVGRTMEQFLIKHSGLVQSPYLATKIEWDEDDQEYVVSSYKFGRIDPDVFEPVADFMNTGDYKPFLVQLPTGQMALKNFDKRRPQAVHDLVIQCINLCNIAGMFGLAQLRHKAIQKFKLLAPYQASEFVRFLKVMHEQEYCNDDELRKWLTQYATDHFYDLLDPEGKFRDFLKATSDFANTIYRLLAGAPVEDKPTGAGGGGSSSKKKAPRKATTGPATVKKEPQETTNKPKPTAPVSKKAVETRKVEIKMPEFAKATTPKMKTNSQKTTPKLQKKPATRGEIPVKRRGKSTSVNTEIEDPLEDEEDEDGSEGKQKEIEDTIQVVPQSK